MQNYLKLYLRAAKLIKRYFHSAKTDVFKNLFYSLNKLNAFSFLKKLISLPKLTQKLHQVCSVQSEKNDSKFDQEKSQILHFSWNTDDKL